MSFLPKTKSFNANYDNIDNIVLNNSLRENVKICAST
jgi:hypothetical protein